MVLQQRSAPTQINVGMWGQAWHKAHELSSAGPNCLLVPDSNMVAIVPSAVWPTSLQAVHAAEHNTMLVSRFAAHRTSALLSMSSLPQHMPHTCPQHVLVALQLSIPVLDQPIPAACGNFAAFQGVPGHTNADTIVCLDGARHLEGVRPLPEKRAALRVACTHHSRAREPHCHYPGPIGPAFRMHRSHITGAC